MIRRSIAFMLFVSAASVAVSAQTPEPKTEAERAPRVMTWTSEGAGGYLGVQTKDVNAENFASFGLSAVRGVAVEKVMEGSPAEKAQLQKRDVIVRFGGDEVTSARKLTRLVSEVAPDHQVTLTVVRGGAEQSIPVTIGKRAVPAFGEGAFSMAVPGAPGVPFPDIPEFRGEMPNIRVYPPMPGGEGGNVTIFRGSSRRIGASVTPLTKQLADHFGVKNGVMISDVREGSPAAKANLKAGDIIVEVDGKEVIGEGDVVRAISEKKEGDVSLTIVRKGDRRTVNVTPEEVKDVYERLIGPEGPVPARPARPMAPTPLDQLFVPGRVVNWFPRSSDRAIIAPRF
jgi:serine protease Do